jgi:hypothetical protein
MVDRSGLAETLSNGHIDAGVLATLCRQRGLTERQTAFTVNFLAVERNASKAYRESYDVKVKTATRWVMIEALKLLRHPKIAPLIQEYRDKVEPAIAQAVVDISAVNRASILNQLRKIGFANLSRYGRIDEEGQFIVDLSACSEDDMAAIQEIKVEETTDAVGKVMRRTWIKLSPPRQALELMGREIGMFPLQHKVEVEDTTPPEVREERAKQRRQTIEWLREMERGRHLPAPAPGGPIIDQEPEAAPAKPNGKGNGHDR